MAQVALAHKRGWALSMLHYCRDALAAGWSLERALLRVEEALVDAGESRMYVGLCLSWLREYRELPEVTNRTEGYKQK